MPQLVRSVQFCRADDTKLVASLHEAFSEQHQAYVLQKKSSDKCFTIRHYAGDVPASAQQMCFIHAM